MKTTQDLEEALEESIADLSIAILSHDTSYSTMNSNTAARGWRWQVNSVDALTISSSKAISMASTLGLGGDITVTKSGSNALVTTATNTTTNSSGIRSDISGQAWLYGCNWGATDGRFVIYDVNLGAEAFSIAPATKAATFGGSIRRTGTGTVALGLPTSAGTAGTLYNAGGFVKVA